MSFDEQRKAAAMRRANLSELRGVVFRVYGPLVDAREKREYQTWAPLNAMKGAAKNEVHNYS